MPLDLQEELRAPVTGVRRFAAWESYVPSATTAMRLVDKSVLTSLIERPNHFWRLNRCRLMIEKTAAVSNGSIDVYLRRRLASGANGNPLQLYSRLLPGAQLTTTYSDNGDYQVLAGETLAIAGGQRMISFEVDLPGIRAPNEFIYVGFTNAGITAFSWLLEWDESLDVELLRLYQ